MEIFDWNLGYILMRLIPTWSVILEGIRGFFIMRISIFLYLYLWHLIQIELQDKGGIVKRKETDIGQVSAYMCKCHELPSGTSKGLLHFVQYTGSTRDIRY